MPKIINENYSRFYDIVTRAEFGAVLNPVSRCFVAVADVSAEVAEAFAARPGFTVYSDEEYAAWLAAAPVAAETTTTGDPMTDAATDAPDPAKVKALAALGIKRLVEIAGGLGIQAKANDSKDKVAGLILKAGYDLPSENEQSGEENGPPPPPPSAN